MARRGYENESDRRYNNAAEAMEKTYADGACRDSLIDLVADAMHWAKAEGIDFEGVLRMARDHYTTETSSPDDPT
jgi:hypothetical protein